VSRIVERFPLRWPEGWPRTNPAERKQASFGSVRKEGIGKRSLTLAEAENRLMKEIRAFTRTGQPWRIRPESVVISSNLILNKNGSVKSGQREPNDPGVAVYLSLDGQPYVFPCDKWDRAADNIAAIAAHLAAMRGQERWGVGSLKESFAGYALPAIALGSKRAWWEVLGVSRDASLEQVKAAYRRLSKTYHPDLVGEERRADWDLLQSAYGEAMQIFNEQEI